ncbi:MAG: EAL domain-containing protein [Hydrogenovibrio sp.]
MTERTFQNPPDFFDHLTPLPVAVAVAEFDSGQIVFANPMAESLFGRCLADLEGQCQTILHPQDRPNPFHYHQEQLLNHQAIQGIEDVIVTPDGQSHPVEITANLIEMGEHRLMLAVFIPIEKRLTALEALKHKTEEFEALFDNSQVGIMLLKGYRILHQANDRLAEILGYDSAEEMIGLSMEALHLSKERFEAYGKANYDTLSYRKNLHVDYELRKKNGDTVWCRLSGMALDKKIPADLTQGVVWVVDDISDIKAAETSLNLERTLFQDGPTVIFRWCPEPGWPVQYVSPNVRSVFGYDPNDFLQDGLLFADLIHPDDLNSITEEFESHRLNQRKRFEQSYELKTPSGEYRRVYDYSLIEYDDNGDVQAIYGYLIDMTDYLKAQEISSLLLTSTNEGIFGLDQNGRTTFINPAAAKMLGYDEKELIGQNNHHLIHHSHANGETISERDCQMMRPIRTGQDAHVADEVLWRKDGSHFPVEYRSTPISRNQEVVGAVVTFHDISHRQAQEQRIKYLAFHDELTGLPNRRLFTDRLEEELKREKHSTARSALMILDIDHFKDINDTQGHPVGDELLKAITQRIRGVLHETDTFARLGGDEFAVLMMEEISGLEAAQMAERLLNLFKQPFQVYDFIIPVSTSIGITFCEPDHSSDDIISQADIALYEAKYNGRNNFVFYESEMANKVRADVEVLNELKHAIAAQAFQVYYQPQIDTATETVIGVEALIRWFPDNENARAMSSPARFIPIAEDRGLMHDITLWQIGQLVQDIQQFRQAGLKGRVSINISGELLNHIENLVELLEVIEHSDLRFDELEFEITETAYALLTPSEIAVLEEVREQGLELGIDDFGTGYSSLVSLRQYPSTHLKIDKAFIDEVDTNEDDRAIVSATISMAHGLGKRVVAEGVETLAQLERLRQFKCDIIQGFYYAKPMPLQAVCAFIQERS